MSDKLKKYVSEHLEEFNTREPGKSLLDKIDAQLDGKSSSQISSKLLKSKFIWFGAGMLTLTLAVFYAAALLNDSPAKQVAQDIKQSFINTSEPLPQAENPATSNTNETKTTDPQSEPVVSDLKQPSSSQPKRPSSSKYPVTSPSHKDSVFNLQVFETPEEADEDEVEYNKAFVPIESPKTKTDSAEKKPKARRGRIEAPVEPYDMNTYSATLYDHNSLCGVLRIYRFPGKVSLNKGSSVSQSREGLQRLIRTVSCSRLEKTEGMRAIWLKGKIKKKVSISMKKDFKNISLVKKDGSISYPDAISHYYNGLGAISEFNGTYFNMYFKEKLDLVVFFKNAEEGDKVIVDGVIETIVKSKP